MTIIPRGLAVQDTMTDLHNCVHCAALKRPRCLSARFKSVDRCTVSAQRKVRMEFLKIKKMQGGIDCSEKSPPQRVMIEWWI